jgi:hypothetical protein
MINAFVELWFIDLINADDGLSPGLLLFWSAVYKFCYQCPDFPCNNTGFDEHLHKRSVDINNRMKEIGVEKYYEEVKDMKRTCC